MCHCFRESRRIALATTEERLMAVNMVLKRARKAAHRKAVLAERRKTQASGLSLTGRVRLAASRPIRKCLLSEQLFETGLGTLILVRDLPDARFGLATFLLDVFCLGIKDVHFRSADVEEIGTYIAVMDDVDAMASVEPAYARKLMSDLAAWSGSLGFTPHRDFARVEPIFGEVSVADSDATFEFGKDGKPFYVPGPYDSPSMIESRIEQLCSRLGSEGFEYEVLLDGL
jgi:hypothetical protein